MDYQIIPITMAHIEGFRKAVDSVAREKRYLSFLEGPPFEMSKAFVETNLAEGWPHLLAVRAQEVIGWCDITSLNRPVYAHCGELGIGIVADYRGQGIGQALILAALQKAKEKGLSRIELTVFENNLPAIKLYEKCGFMIEGKKRLAVKIDEHYQDLICMALFI